VLSDRFQTGVQLVNRAGLDITASSADLLACSSQLRDRLLSVACPLAGRLGQFPPHVLRERVPSGQGVLNSAAAGRGDPLRRLQLAGLCRLNHVRADEPNPIPDTAVDDHGGVCGCVVSSRYCLKEIGEQHAVE